MSRYFKVGDRVRHVAWGKMATVAVADQKDLPSKIQVHILFDGERNTIQMSPLTLELVRAVDEEASETPEDKIRAKMAENAQAIEKLQEHNERLHQALCLIEDI